MIPTLVAACGARTELIVEDPPALADSGTDTSVATDTTPSDTERVEDTRDAIVVFDTPSDDGSIVLPGTAAKEVVMGSDATCVRTVADRLRCWGSNGNGELGDGTTTKRAAPTPPIDLEGVAQAAVGEGAACARISNGTVRCWGATRNGLLGEILPVPDISTTARQVTGLSDIVDIAVNFDACAVRADGVVLCWGRCRPDVSAPCTSSPTTVMAGAAQVAASWASYCVRRFAGDVWCWGDNSSGQLGDGTTADRLTPAPVPGLTDVAAIAMGGAISSGWSRRGTSVCALKKDGSVWCWGMRLKDGAPREVRRPERVDGLSAAPVRIATNGPLSCALSAMGRVECWGYSANGAFGIPGGVPWESARIVPGAPQSVSVAVGGDRVCAIGTDGLPRCWGAPLVGDGSSEARKAPTLVSW